MMIMICDRAMADAMGRSWGRWRGEAMRGRGERDACVAVRVPVVYMLACVCDHDECGGVVVRVPSAVKPCVSKCVSGSCGADCGLCTVTVSGVAHGAVA